MNKTYLDELIEKLEDGEPIDSDLLKIASNQIDGLFSELAQLRAALQSAQERIAAQDTQIDALHDALTRIREAQARQLEQARDIIGQLYGYIDVARLSEIVDDWLTANAPQAQPEEQAG